MKLHLDKVTRLLCFIVEELKRLATSPAAQTGGNRFELSNGIDRILTNKELFEWYKKHQEADRLAIQKIKEKALAKLSQEEREVLGIK